MAPTLSLDEIPVPELVARQHLYQLLVDKIPADAADVHYGFPPDAATGSLVWVGAVRNDQDQHAYRGAGGRSERLSFLVEVHVAYEDAGGTAEEVDAGCLQLLGLVRALLRQAITARHDFGDGVVNPHVVATETTGPVPTPRGGGHAEQARLDIQFTATI